jgi:hypothetical protein
MEIARIPEAPARHAPMLADGARTHNAAYFRSTGYF